MEFLEDGGYVVTGAGEQSSSRVLNVLEFIEELDAVAVVNSGRDEGGDQGFCS